MVWGMREPGSFGDYFPDGEFVGWKEGVKSYFENEMSPEERAKYDNWDVNYRGSISRKFAGDLGALEEHQQPKDFQTVKTYTNIASLTLLGLLAVDEELKDIIETLEPGVHQFWPITITMPKGVVYPKQYYGLRIGGFIGTFSPEQSDPGSFRIALVNEIMFYNPLRPSKECIADLAFDTKAVGSSHLWREREHLQSPDYFFSDALHDEITRRAQRMPPFYKLKAV